MKAWPAWSWWAIGAFVVAAVAGSAFFAGEGRAPQGPRSVVGSPLPALPLRTLDGKTIILRARPGEVLVVNLWASWCPPCREEMPDLERFFRAFHARGVEVVGVDQGESAGTAGAFAHALGVDYPILLDPDEAYGRALSTFGLPTTAIVDRRGVVRIAVDGPLTYGRLAADVTRLLHEQ
jgi:cytochrome c biogenesis protein CcmG/thiol:disulfide interchange protein DsbE